MTCLNPICENYRKELRDYKFCPECGGAAKPSDLSYRITGSVNSGIVGNVIEVSLSAEVRQAFCFIPSGSFVMGSPADENGRGKFFNPGIIKWLTGHLSNEGTVEVNLSQPFWLAKTQVTQAQWQAVMDSNPSSFKGPNLPVEEVYWRDADAYISEINGKQMLPKGWKFALPTEAQWEYACRAGEKGPYSGGSLDEVGWYGGNSGKTHEVGQKKPNAWGLYDMHGNVFEWCADWYDDTPHGGVDPKGPESGQNRVLRGGSWESGDSFCRAACRPCWGVPNFTGDDVGFRTAIVPSN